jgi:spore coat polysaccharide biosynthesis protein SpsF (cytidylyltransferase family)
MEDNEGLEGAADRVRPVALALIEIGAARLPGRALLQLPEGGLGALERLAGAAREVGWVQRVVVVACSGSDDEGAAAEADRLGMECVRAPSAAAALRSLGAAPDQIVLRLPVSCPLLPPEVIGAAIEALLGGGHDHVSTDLGSGVLPAGLDVEACRAGRL